AAGDRLGQRGKHSAAAVLQPAKHSEKATTGDERTQVPGGDVLQVVRLVQDQAPVSREDSGRVVIPLCLPDPDVGEEQVVVHHQNVRGGRFAARSLIETLLEMRAAGAQADVRLGGNLVPHLSRWPERQVGQRAVLRLLQPLHDRLQLLLPIVGEQRGRALPRQPCPPDRYVVGAPLHQGEAEVLPQGGTKKREILADELFLQV